jgi:hypothetical protein
VRKQQLSPNQLPNNQVAGSPPPRAALTPSPPWHYAGGALAVEFSNDPGVAADTHPTGVELDASRAGHSVALFADSPFTARNDEHLDPARYRCREFIVYVGGFDCGRTSQVLTSANVRKSRVWKLLRQHE